MRTGLLLGAVEEEEVYCKNTRERTAVGSWISRLNPEKSRERDRKRRAERVAEDQEATRAKMAGFIGKEKHMRGGGE